MLTENEDR